ncbi:MAG: hypothetical protein VW397_00830 [Candidatus Margulisiibacteriota bacterium]
MDKLRCGFLTNFLVKKSTPEPSLENIYKTIKAMNQFFEKQKDASLYQNGFMLDGVFYDGTYCAPIFKCFKRLKILDKTGAITNNTFKTFYETLTDENLQKKLTDFKDMSSNQTVYSNNGFIVNGQPITRDALTPFFKILSKLGIATRSSGDLRSCLLGRAKVYSLEMSKFSQFHTNPSDVSSPPKIGGVKCTLPDSLPPRPQTKLPPINREFYNQFLVQARGQYDALLTTLMPNKELMERIQSLEFERPLSNEFQIFDQVLSELMKPYQERQPIHYFKYNDLDNTDMNGDLTPRFTVPSIKHQNDNQDRVEVVKLGCDTVIILSDGVSECSNQFSEKGSGKDMAIHLTTTFKDYCESNKFKNKLQELKQGLQGNMYNSKEFLTHISKFKRQMVGEIVVSTRVAFSNEGDQSKQTNLGAATFTLSLALDLGQAGRYLLSMFYGDSQTILRKQDGRIIQLNPFLLANNQSKPDKIFLENDLEQVADFKRFSDPGQTVDYDNVNNPKLLPYVSIVPINAGDQYVVCSDGVGDGISTLDEDKQSAKLNKDLFGDILMFCKQNGMMDKEIAAFIACLSLKLSPKQDDIALAVHSVGALDLLGISRDSNQCYAISAVQFLRHMPMGKFGSVFNYLSYLKTNMDNDKLTYQGENFSFDSQAKNSRLRKNTIDFWLKLLDPDLRKTTPNQKLGFIKDILLYFPAFGRGQNCPGEFLNCAFFNLFTISYTP